MITDAVMEVIDMLIEMCSNEEQVKGMKSVREILADFNEDDWLQIEDPAEKYDRLEQYLSCRRKIG